MPCSIDLSLPAPADRLPRISRVCRLLAPLMLSAMALALAGCGGGSSKAANPPGGGTGTPPPAPTIQEFAADRALFFVGEDASLTARFTGGTGRIEPGIGEVQSGVPVAVRGLSGPVEFTLTVTSAAGTVSRTLALRVDYRDQYRPAADQFAAIWHTASLLPDGNVLLIGGWRGGMAPSADFDLFDVATGEFQAMGALQVARQYHRSVVLPDGTVLVTGGDSWLGETPSAELVDPDTGNVRDAGEPVESRSDHSATLLPDGRVLLVGGIGTDGDEALGISNSAEIWDPASETFRRVEGRMSVARVGHAAALLPDGRVLVVGGWTMDTDYVLAEVFDPATETFSPVPSPDDRVRLEHTVLQLDDGSVLVMGGGVLADDPLAGLLPSSSVLRFFADGTGAEVLPELAGPRALAVGGLADNGRAYLFGGMADWQPTARAESYSPDQGSTAIASLPFARYSHTVTRLADGRMLIAGGENDTMELIPLALIYE